MKIKLLIVFALVAIAVAAALWLVHAPARRMSAYLDQLRDVVPGETSEAELLSKPVFRDLPRNCHEDLCEYAFTASNGLLNTLHLAPETLVNMNVSARNGLVTEIWVSGSMFSRTSAATTSVQEVPVNSGCGPKPCMRLQRTPPHAARTYMLTGIMFDADSQLHGQISSAVNLACLSRLRGCATQGEFVPLGENIHDFVELKSWPFPPKQAVAARPAFIKH